MILSQIKDKLYDSLVVSIPEVQKHYEGYKDCNTEYHNKNRFKSLKFLFALRRFYKKGKKGNFPQAPKPYMVKKIASDFLSNDQTPTVQLKVKHISTNSIELEWTQASDVKVYNLYRSDNQKDYKFLIKGSENSYIDKDLKPGTTYYYKLKYSLNGQNYRELKVLKVKTESSNSKSINTAISVVSLGVNQIELKWNSIANAMYYNLYRSENQIDYKFLTKTSSLQFVDTDVKNEHTYYYKIKYTLDDKSYKELPQNKKVELPKIKNGLQNTPPLYKAGAESTYKNRPLPIQFAKYLSSYDLISFDIFDTLLFRPFSKPSDLFILVGERLDIMDFSQIRISAESKAREYSKLTRGNTEVTLYEIYKFIEDETGVPAKDGCELELSIEMELCFANPYMLTVYKLLKSMGKKLVALSDMYIPHDKMKQLLEHCGFVGLDEIIVSCDYNCSKRNGDLYDLLLDKYKNIDKSKIIHVGDNAVSDIKVPQERNIHCFHYENVNEVGEQFRCNNMTYLVGSAYRGLVNAHLHNGTKKYSPYYEVGFVYAGIYVMGFCQWIYRYAQEHNLDKILFLAREGDIYQKVFRSMYPDFKTEYVLWSRVPVAKTIVKKNRHPYLLQLVHHKANALYKSKIGTLFEKIGIAPLKKYLEEYHLNETEFLLPTNEKMVYQLLVDHWDELCECYDVDNQNIKDYLSLVIGDSKNAAVVDVGWSGNNVLQVKYLVEEVYHLDCNITCMLAATRNVNDTYIAAMMQKQEVKTYIFSTLQNRGLHDLHQATNNRLNSFFFEILTQSCTPTFLGFEGKHFLYDIPETENYEHNRQIHQGILDFTKMYMEHFKDFPYMLDIPGHDAYMPFCQLTNDLSWFKMYFKDYAFGRDLFATQEKAVMETVYEVMEKAKVWGD